MLIAYGSSNPASGSGLASFEARCRARFPGLPIRWAYTSTVMRQRLARQRKKSDSVTKALLRLNFEKYSRVAVQPLHLVAGREYGEVKRSLEEAQLAARICCALGAPLLSADPDKVAQAIITHLPPERRAGEDVVFMAHGARHAAEAMYSRLADALCAIDARLHVATMSGSPDLCSVLPRLASERAWLMPLLSSAGLHALRDMAGSSPASWRAQIEKTGRICKPVLTGMIECEAIASIWLDHLARAIELLPARSGEPRKSDKYCT